MPALQKPNFERLLGALNSNYFAWYLYAARQNYSLLEFISEQEQIDTSLTLNPIYGSLYVNGILAAPENYLQAPCLIEYYQPKVLSTINQHANWSLAQHIVYDNDGIVVCFKPTGLHTYPAKEQQNYSLLQFLEQHFKSDIHIPTRLDYSTSGLVLASYTKSSHGFAQKLYQERWIKKLYLFATASKPDWDSQRVKNQLSNDPRHPVLRQEVHIGGQSALTDFSVLATTNELTLVRAIPHTGRTHQIRVHAAGLGLPICGDNFYAGIPANELHLTCYQLSFPKAADSSIVTVSVPEPFKPAWLSKFKPTFYA